MSTTETTSVDNVCILAGGSGTRLWPASNSGRPKQFIPVHEGKSLLLLTVERALALGTGDLFIVTLDEQIDSVAEECAKLSVGKERIKLVAEPAPRNTAPAIAAAASILRNNHRSDETMAVLPSDHLITPTEAFAADMKAAASLASRGFLVTFGIHPSRPETGYGYIEAGEAVEGGRLVRRFREKPDLRTAEAFCRSGDFFWNSGMFCFRIDRFFEELETGREDIAGVFSSITVREPSQRLSGMDLFFRDPEVKAAYGRSPRESVDYAVMEKCRRTAMVEASFTWNDIGSWDELSQVIDNDLELSGQERGKAIAIDSKGCFVHSDLPVALCGVDDLIVVQENGVLLVCKKGEGQLVKKAVEAFREKGLNRFL
ncbi:mannose-1-phosphate guanylyltransferase [Sediminispirochaeta bajacaliforniensis]|uniref:mannose-1-phosphate guanylyltransferase n=1 Tax=Sediminispirochaeta bajacaliforniensis TaxID=148 RepID=UPI0003815186|nr:sugar phosphate nucleotidyltransferase [Sediminispirochaeta bajacaliforniensis]